MRDEGIRGAFAALGRAAFCFGVAVMLGSGGAVAQGFAGMGSAADPDFAVPERGKALVFPQDHGAHPDYRIEWWYLTANLKGEDGQDYGVQWTLFRSALAPEERADARATWQSAQIWMGHAGLTTPEAHFSAERFARGGIGQAGVTARPFDAWIDDWSMTNTAPDAGDAFDALSVRAQGTDFAYALTMEADGPLVFQGDRGYSVKSPQGQASYYYSQPHLQVTGSLTLPEGEVAVTGTAWLDREWSSQPLAPTQTGWDWVSLHFDSGAKLMGFRLRDTAGPNFTAATWIAADGTPTPLADGDLQFTSRAHSDVAGRRVPTAWQLDLPAQDLTIEVRAVNPQSWMDTAFPYWEGPVRVTGSHPGRGYLEMTGYE